MPNMEELERRVRKLDEELSIKTKQLEELRHMYMKKMDTDLQGLMKLNLSYSKIINNIIDRIELLEQNVGEKKVDKDVNEMFR